MQDFKLQQFFQSLFHIGGFPKLHNGKSETESIQCTLTLQWRKEEKVKYFPKLR